MKWSLAINLPLIAAPRLQSLFLKKFFYPWLKLPAFPLEPRECSVTVFSPQLYSLAALSRRRGKPEALWKAGPDVIPPSTGPMNACSPATHGHSDSISMASGALESFIRPRHMAAGTGLLLSMGISEPGPLRCRGHVGKQKQKTKSSLV